MKKTHYYQYTNFTKSNIRDLNSEKGLFVYKVIALPMSFSKKNQQKSVISTYIQWLSNFFLHKWDKKKNLNIMFDKNSLIIELPSTKSYNIDKMEYLHTINEEYLFQIYSQMISFLPPLYIGITTDIATRFISHTNDSDQNSLINKIRACPEISENEILFVWQSIDIKFVEQFLNISTEEARDILLEELETMFIHLNNPIFNSSKRS